MNTQEKGILLLVKSALNGKKYNLPDGFDFSEAYQTAKSHQILPLIYYGAMNCKLNSNADEIHQFFLGTCVAISYNENQLFEENQLFDAFDNDNIDYMPLKGAIIKHFYPKPEMRIMSDLDILIRTEQYEKIIPIMESLGYSFKGETEHELAWKKNNIKVELHKCLVSKRNQDICGFFDNIWDNAKCKSGNQYVMSNEDFYIYLFIHFVKHYRAGGIGIKHMTDLWVCKNALAVDETYIDKKIKALGLKEFYLNINYTLSVWFGSSDSNSLTEYITDVIFNSGAYGKINDIAVAQMARRSQKNGNIKNARISDIIYLIFPKYGDMCYKYPALKKKAFLLPYFWFLRWMKAIFIKRKNIVININSRKNISDKNIHTYEESLKYVGLSFKLNENRDMRD